MARPLAAAGGTARMRIRAFHEQLGNGQAHFGAAAAPILGHVTYVAIAALVINLAVTVVLTLVFRLARLPDGYDETRRADYIADPVDRPAVRKRPVRIGRHRAAVPSQH